MWRFPSLLSSVVGGVPSHLFKVREWYADFRQESLLYKTVFVLLVFPLLLPLCYAVGILFWHLTANSLIYQLFSSIFLKTLLFQIIVEVAFILYVVFILREKKYNPFFTLIHVLLLGFGVVLVLSSLFSPDANASFFGSPRRGDGVFFLLHVGLYIFLLSWVIRDRRALGALFSAAIAGGLATLFFIALTILIVTPQRIFTPEAWYRLLEGSAGNPNFVAHYFLLLLLLCVYFVLQKPILRRFFVPTILLLAIILTSSHTAIILGGVVYVVLLGLVSRWLFYVAILGGLGGALYVALTGDALLVLWQSFVDSMHIRLLLWKDAMVTIFGNRPWFGYGWGNNELAWNFASSDTPAQFYTSSTHFFADRMHNIILESLSAAGFVGLFMMLIFFVYLLSRSIRTFRTQRTLSSLFFFSVFSVQFVYLLFNFDTLMSYILVGLLLAGFILLHEGWRYPLRLPRAAARGIVPIVGIFGAFVIVYGNLMPFRAFLLKMKVDTEIVKASSYVTPPTQDIIEKLDLALSIRQPYRSLWRDLAASFYDLSDTVTLSAKEKQHLYSSLTALYKELLAHSPMSVNAYHNLALIEFKFAQNFQKAQEYLREAVRLAPANGLLRFQLGLLYFNGGDQALAKEVFTQLLDEGVYVGPVSLYLGFIDFKEGRVLEGKKKVITALSSYHPRDHEWDHLAVSFLTHSNKKDLLVWYQKFVGLLKSPSPYLYKKIVLLAKELGRDDLVDLYAKKLR